MPKIVSLKDNNSIIKYPATISDAVIDLGTGKKLSDIIDSLFDYLYFEAVQDSNISFTKASGLTIDLKYKIDNGKWQNYSSQITLAAGHKAYFKGDNEKISESGKLSKFIITGGVNVGGNIMSLLGFRSQPGKNSFSCLFDYCTGILSTENLKLPATTLAQNCYEGMFRGCSSLTTPPQLPATTLASYCYYYMFMGCTSLTTPPQLPATTLVSGCYYQMFINCTSLIKAPELPATTLAQDCYGSMFQGCTSLVEVPSILPATTLVQSCYQSMFSGCTSLTTTPSLPATTLALFCYDSMFYGCTSLVEVPSILPATTLAQGCYGLMFYGCTSLEKAPELPAPTLVGDCYGMMFYECSKLNYIKALFTTSPTTQTYDWVNGVAPSGTFIKSSEATWNVNGNNGVPANWIIYKSLPTSNQSKIYTNVLRKDASYSSPYSKSYFYFGQLKQIDLLRPSYIKYRVIAYTPGNGNYMLDSIVEWDFGYNGIYKSYCIYNNLSSTSYYPFGYHTLYRSNSAAITQSDGSYFGFYFGSSNSYGQSASTVARTIEVEILECYNCEATLIDSPICLTDAADVPANFRQTSTSVAYNTTNFTAVNVSTGAGLQETGDANSDTVGYSIRTNSYSKPMKSALGYGYRLLFTSGDKLGWVPANNSTSSNATAVRTPATDPIDPFGEIVYYSGTAAVAANSRPSATTLWEQYTVGLGYSFNTTGAALTLTSWEPVYVKCTPQVNGSAVIEGYTQDLPTEEDGFIYIYLGVAYSATAIELVIKHPVYYFKDGLLLPWTGKNRFKQLAITYNSGTSTLDTTWEKIRENITNGGKPYLIVIDSNYNKTPFQLTYVDDLGRGATFSGIDVIGSEIRRTRVQISNSDTVTFSYDTLAEIPEKTSDLTNNSNFPSDANYVHTDNNYTTTEKNKLNGIAAGAEVNQNAFSNVKVGSTTIAADSKTDTLELVAGSNITLTPDATNDKVTIAATDTTYSAATTSAAGLMSAADKTKLDGIAAGAQVNVVTSVDTTATAGVNLSLTSGKLDVTVTGGSIASGNGSVVTGGTVYAVTSTLAPKASPALTGTPTAPTAAAGTNTTQIATTAFVKNAVDSKTHYVANLQSGDAANYITEPEFKSVKVNGSTTNSASSSNCVLQYDTTNKCLKFIFN